MLQIVDFFHEIMSFLKGVCFFLTDYYQSGITFYFFVKISACCQEMFVLGRGINHFTYHMHSNDMKRTLCMVYSISLVIIPFSMCHLNSRILARPHITLTWSSDPFNHFCLSKQYYSVLASQHSPLVKKTINSFLIL